MKKHVVGLSGGKDSTATALALNEFEPRDYTYICTPTGHELPEMIAWWEFLEGLLGKPIVRITNHDRTLDDLVQIHNALPNHRQRWCTRQLKIEPTIAWIVRNSPAVLYVGLRADEDEREGIYSDLVESDFPFKRWGWGIKDVYWYLDYKGIKPLIPKRTDCYDCYAQRISEWRDLWGRTGRTYMRLRASGRTRRGIRIGHHHVTLGQRDCVTWPKSLQVGVRYAETKEKMSAGCVGFEKEGGEQ